MRKNQGDSLNCLPRRTKNRTFADMNSDSFYILLLSFVSGMTQCLLTLCGIYMLLKHRNYQFQRVFAVVLILHGFGFFNNFVVLACTEQPEQPYSEFLNTLLVLFDYVIVGGYMMFGVSLVFPNRYKTRQLLLLVIPYLIAMLLFALSRSPLVLTVMQIYTVVVSLVLLVYLVLSIRKHTRLLLDNVGDLELWSNILIVLYFAFQLLWTIESLSQQSWFSEPSAGSNLLFDTLYCLICIGIVLYVMHKLIHQQVFTLFPADECENVPQEPTTHTPQPNAGKSLIGCDIDMVMKEKRYIILTTR